MNRYAMYHATDCAYCFPVSEKEIVLRLRTARGDMKRVQVIYESKYVFGQTQKRAVMRKACSSELYDYYTVTLRLTDTRLAYIFYLESTDGDWYFSEDGVSRQYDYKLGFYNFFQYPYINRVDIMEPVEWMRDAVFYQVFVDRFYMADQKKDRSYINCAWGELPKPKSFAGGDLAGVTEKLDYIRSLGCSTLYLTPVFCSHSNHKYDIYDYYRVDEQFGGNEALKKLIREAHRRGMRVVLDAVFNHCSEDLPQFQDVIRNGKKSPYYDWFCIFGDKPDPEKQNYESFFSCPYMPKFNTSNGQVQQFLADIGCYYLEEYGIDGWRLDVCDEVSRAFWKYFRQRIKQCNPQAVIIGENWHDASASLRGDQYDSVMNYSFTKACLDYFAAGRFNAQQMAWKLGELLMRNNDTVNSMMLNLLDSHDTHRFFSEIGKDREAMKAALCLLYLFPGAPCIFYGTEILTQGGYDPDCRRCMDWEKTKPGGGYEEIARLLKDLAAIRREKKTTEGVVSPEEKDGVFILRNRQQNRELTLYINRTDRRVDVEGVTLNAMSHCITENGGIIL